MKVSGMNWGGRTGILRLLDFGFGVRSLRFRGYVLRIGARASAPFVTQALALSAVYTLKRQLPT